MKSNNKIGFLGFGILGSLLFEKFLKINKSLLIYNRSLKKLKNIRKKVICSNPNELFNKSKIIFIILRDDKSIKNIFSKIKSNNLEKKIFINLSTNSFLFSKKIFYFLKKRNSTWVDAPILGSTEALQNNNLTFLYAGKKIKLVQKMLKKVGRIIHYKQPCVSQILKLCHNAVCGQIMISMGEILKIANKYKINEKLFFEMFEESAFYSSLVRNKLLKFRQNNYKPSFSYFNMMKDLKLFNDTLKMTKNLNLSMSYKMYKKFYNKNIINKDSSYISKLIKKS